MISEERFAELVRKELLLRVGKIFLDVRISRESGFMSVSVLFEDFSFNFVSGKDLPELVERWTAHMKTIHGAQSLEEMEMFLDSEAT